MKMDFQKIALLSAATFLLTACNQNSGPSQLVECYGVAKSGNNVPLLMTKDMCDKIDSSKPVPLSATNYVQCYGVAKAGQNACATATSSCGGKSTSARSKDAWVSLPLSICQNLKGGIVKKAKPGAS